VTDAPADGRGEAGSVPAVVATLALVAEAALAISATALAQFANFQPVAESLTQGKLLFAAVAIVAALWGAWCATGRRRLLLVGAAGFALLLAFF
jgi:hypothetical protein